MSSDHAAHSIRRATVCAWLSLTALLVGCTHTYGLDRQREAGRVLPSSASLYVALPEPGRYQSQYYAESGRQTRDAIAQAFRSHVAKVQIGGEPEGYEAALSRARALGATHLVLPTIDHWEERATEWSGKPDRIIIDIKIFEVASGGVVDAAEVSGKSRWGTLGGDHPQELLPRAVGDYVDVLFGVSSGG